MGLLKKVVYLTEAQKQTLFSTGTITVNISGADITVNHSNDDIYIIPQSWNADGESSDNYYLKDITDTIRLALSSSGELTVAGLNAAGISTSHIDGIDGFPISLTTGASIPAVTTANRPMLQSHEKGVMVLDTTLGKPIWWNGTNWIDSSGTIV